MTDARRRCTKCKKQFTPRRGNRRVTCFVCRPERLKTGPESMSAPTRAECGPVEAAAIAELERAERLQSLAGQISLRLARDLDSLAMTGSQASSLSAQLLKTVDAATGGAPAEPDEIDEFTRRAREKRASA